LTTNLITTLITTKLIALRPPQTVVERPRLLEQLELGLRGKLILVSAPAGSGKSTLLASWLQGLDRPTAWLSLDAGDNDLERFLLYLVSALQRVSPSIGAGLPEVLQHQTLTDSEALLTRLINDIAGFGQNVLLVLDDYHLLVNEKVHGCVEFLLEGMPPGLCLVMATRTDPPLTLARLRVRQQLVEVRALDLRFSVEETNAFMNDRLKLELSSKAISSLEARTEGWVGALQLAALSLGGRKDKESFVQAFAGSHHHLVDYLIDEVLGRQTPEVREFLQRTSILERFTASLCEAVSGQAEGQNLLRQLDHANLFLIPLDDERQWYRYHHLFAEFLRHHLRSDHPEQIPQLHQRASEWLEREGWSDEAIHHALLANDLGRAGRLVESIAFHLQNTSNNTQLIKYVSRFPLELLSTLPRVGIYYGWALINTGQVALLSNALPVIERSAAHAQQPRVVRSCVLQLQAYQRLWQMDFAGVVKLCHEALAVLDQGGEESISDEERWLRTAANNLIPYSYFFSDLVQTDAVYPVARALSQRLGNFIGAANDFARHGWVKHRLGQLHQAMVLFRQGLSALQGWQTEGGGVVNVGELSLNLARLLYEWNRLNEAQTHLQKASEFNQRSQFPPVLAAELETAVLFHLAKGEPEAAQTKLGQLDQMLAEVHPDNLLYQQLFGVMTMNLRLHLVAVVPAFQLIAEVAAWVRANQLKAEDDFDYAHEGSYVVLSRLLIIQGKPSEALPLLERLGQAARTEGRIEHLIRAQLLQALGHTALGQTNRALSVLTQALELAEPQGFCRLFVDQGPALHGLLKQLAQQPTHQENSHLHHLLRAFPTKGNHTSPPIPEPAAIPKDPEARSKPDGLELGRPELGRPELGRPEHDRLEPLSERERAILRLLNAGHSNKEIGKALGLSPNTVRWYVSNLLGKLGVGNRFEAVSRARELGLV
jgi:LuxR family transcriptional regulator, maltose regulon positive regulatory protein